MCLAKKKHIFTIYIDLRDCAGFIARAWRKQYFRNSVYHIIDAQNANGKLSVLGTQSCLFIYYYIEISKAFDFNHCARPGFGWIGRQTKTEKI